MKNISILSLKSFNALEKALNAYNEKGLSLTDKAIQFAIEATKKQLNVMDKDVHNRLKESYESANDGRRYAKSVLYRVLVTFNKVAKEDGALFETVESYKNFLTINDLKATGCVSRKERNESRQKTAKEEAEKAKTQEESNRTLKNKGDTPKPNLSPEERQKIPSSDGADSESAFDQVTHLIEKLSNQELLNLQVAISNLLESRNETQKKIKKAKVA